MLVEYGALQLANELSKRPEDVDLEFHEPDVHLHSCMRGE